MDPENQIEDRGDELPTEPVEAPETPAPAPEPEVTPDVAPEPPPEPEATPEPKGEALEDPNDRVMIPKSRYDNAARLRREAEARVRQVAEENAALRAQLEGRPQATPAAAPSAPNPLEDQLGQIDQEMAKAISDGDTERQVALTRQARALERQLITAEVEARVAERVRDGGAATVEDIHYDTMVSRLEAEHPQINPDGPSYDADAAAEVLELKEAFEARGMRPTAALEKAMRYVFPEKPEAATPVAPAAGSGARKPDVGKAVDTASRLPPDLNRTGMDGDKAGMTTSQPAVDKLSEADFAALPADTLRRLRGDYV